MKAEPVIDFQLGTYMQKEPLFIELIDYFKSLGINALYVRFEDNMWLQVGVLTKQEVVSAREIAKIKGADIIDKFFLLFEKYGETVTDSKSQWLPDHFIGFYSFESNCITNLVWRCRLKVLEALNSSCIYAQYVFYRAPHDGTPKMLPGYYVFFENADALAKVNESQRQKIRSICIKQLACRDKSGFFSPDKIEIEFRDAITDAYAVGHLSRDVD